MRALSLLTAAALALCACRSTPPATHSGEPARELQLEFSGNSNFGDGRLLDVLADELRDAARRGPSKAAVDDCAWTLEEFYRTRGYPDVSVAYEHLDPDEGAFVGKLQITEGRQCIVERITIQGTHFRPAAELLGFFEGERDGLFGSGPLIFDSAQLTSAAAALESYYFAEGFLTVRVDDPVLTFTEDRSGVSAEVTVFEGPRHHLREISFSGDLGLAPATFDTLRESLTDIPYTPRTPYEIRASLISAYGNSGYPDAEIAYVAEVDAETGDVAVAFTLDCRAQVTVGAVEVSGNDKTRGSFIRSRLSFESGKTYDARELRDSFRELYRTGLFETVDIGLAEADSIERDIHVRLTEAPTIELFVEPGYGSYEGPRLRAGAIDKNLFGMGRLLSLESTVGAIDNRVEVALTDPWLFGETLVGTASVSASEREEPSFTLTEVATNLGASREFGPHWAGSLSYGFRATELADVDVVDSLAVAALENVDISSIALSMGRDSRDNRLVPARGAIGRGTLEWGSTALGSDLDFLRFDLHQAVFFDLAEGRVLGLSARTGVIVPVASSSVIPLQERYFNGGENSVRSFGESEVGPQDADGHPLGGETFALLSAELRERLAGNLYGAAFVDAGNVAADHADYFDFEDFRSGIGVGLRYMLPIGPLRLDGAINPDPRPQEDDFAIHLSVGMSF